MGNKKAYKKMLDDICSDDCPSEKTCILKEFLISSHPSPKLLMQLKCVDKFKKIIATEKGINIKEVLWNEAFEIWAERGMATKFSLTYDEDCCLKDTWKKLMSDQK